MQASSHTCYVKENYLNNTFYVLVCSIKEIIWLLNDVIFYFIFVLFSTNFVKIICEWSIWSESKTSLSSFVAHPFICNIDLFHTSFVF